MNNFFKKITIILFNIIAVIFILVCADYLQYKSFYNETVKTLPNEVIKANNIPTYRKSFTQVYSTNTIQSLNEYYYNGEWGYLRKPVLKSTNKPSILMFGGSFLYGSFLPDEQTFAYKLSQTTSRSTYNYGVEAGGFAQMLYFLRDENFYKHIKQPPEYVIYLYISNHQKRLNTNMYPYPLWLCGYNLQYKIKNGKLVIKQNWPAFIYKPFLIKKIYSAFDKINNKNTKENMYKRFEMTNKILLESKNLLENHYGKIKFIIIDYTYDYEKEREENDIPFMWTALEKEGFIIIHSKDLIGRDFSINETTKDKFHPSEKVWDLLVPALVKKLNL